MGAESPSSSAGTTVQPTGSDAAAAPGSSSSQPAAGSPAQQPTATPGQQAPAAGSPGGTQPPASATARPADGWVPPTREQWEGTERARRAAIAQAKQHERDLKTERQRIQALVGASPVKPEDAERQQVADAFFSLFPQFQMFKEPGVAEKLAKVLERSDELSQASDHVWDGLTRRTLDSIATKFAEETGIDPATVTDDDRAELAALFFQMARRDPAAFQKRYEQEDPKLVDEFVTRLKTRYFDPARRTAAAGMVRGQPRVPSGGPGRPVVSAPPTIDFSNPQAVEDAAVEYLKERGHLAGA
jgi:hypothetical protein